ATATLLFGGVRRGAQESDVPNRLTEQRPLQEVEVRIAELFGEISGHRVAETTRAQCHLVRHGFGLTSGVAGWPTIAGHEISRHFARGSRLATRTRRS